MNNNYTVFHLHTEVSLLDSCTNFKLYVDKAKELNQTAICFTEHGNVYNWIEKKMYCDEQGIKYIHGVECYLTKELLQIDEENPEPHKVRDNYHTILIARNYEGVKEINLLIDKSTQEDHVYYKNRITFNEFKSISDNVIKISACLASPLNKLRDESLISYYDYLEVQPHVNSMEQKEYNIWLHKMSQKYNKPLIAGTDTHSLNKYKAECRSILQRAKHIVFTNEDEFDLTYKSYDEIVEMFKQQNALSEEVYLDAIENTNKMAESVEVFELDKSFKYAKCYDDDEKVLKQRLNQKYKEKLKKGIITNDRRYIENVREELRVFKKIGMLGFMLFMSDLVTWCWENGIPIGFCRGSVGGSTIAYLIDIIDVDPVVWHTVFSRFANENRTELGDIDIDISPTQRHLVYEHIIEKFGVEYTAYILAIGTISDKGTIDEIGRALSDQWIENNHTTYNNPYSLNNIAAIKKEYEIDPEATKQKYPDIFYYFDGLLNTAISQSMHPAGIIVSPETLSDNYGSFWADGKRILQINMEECHEVNLNKYDLLGLKNVEIIKDTCALANIPYPKSHEIDWEDANVWDDMMLSPAGIFQFEGDFAFKMLKSFCPRKINDMSMVNAALRPSGTSYRDRLLAHEFNKNPSEIIDDLLKNNNGFLIFQEDTIAFLQQICGLSGSDADNVRRAIGRKQKDRLEAALPQILEGYCSKSNKPREISEKEAKEFLQIIEDSSNYQFGFNHSTGYSMIGYTCAYMRYYHPEEFIAAYLNNANNEDDIRYGTELAKVKNIKINPIKFRHSSAKYTVDKTNHCLYKGLLSVKFLSSDLADQLYILKDEHFESFAYLLKVFPGNTRQLEILIRLGFFEEFGAPGKLLKIMDIYNTYYSKKQIKKDVIDDKIKLYIQNNCDKETAKQYKFEQGLDCAHIDAISDIYQDKQWTTFEVVNSQLEYNGYIEYKNDSFPPEIYCIADHIIYKGSKTPSSLVLYRIKDGNSITVKLKNKDFNEESILKGNFIKVPSLDWLPKKKKDPSTGKWVATDEHYYSMTSWSVIRQKIIKK